MRISTKGRYAVFFLLDLAQHTASGFVPLQEVAKRQHLSKKYLEQVVPVLVKAGLLTASRGAQGGYQLTKTPSRYTLAEILRLTETTLFSADDSAASGDVLQPVCDGMNRALQNYLRSISLQDLLSRQQAGNDYVI